jgi:hypothetical protein
MGPVSLRIRYRPLRIGWCIEANSLDHFSTAVSISHVLWGGRFNPIILCANRDLASALISAFNVDALYNVSGSPGVDEFIKGFPYIQWPEFHPELFVEVSPKNGLHFLMLHILPSNCSKATLTGERSPPLMPRFTNGLLMIPFAMFYKPLAATIPPRERHLP